MASRSVLVLQHVPWEGPAIIGEVLDENGLNWSSRIVVNDTDPAALPSMEELAGVVLMGGPMSAQDYSGFPGLGLEAELVRLAVDEGVPVLGVCLGHQIVGAALGGELHLGAAHEVGIGTVRAQTDGFFGDRGSETPVLHWHSDIVEAPSDAVVLASSDLTPNQAFRIGNRVLGVQFHVELDRTMLERWLAVPEMAEDLDARTRATISDDFERASAEMRVTMERVAGLFARTALERT